MLGCTTVCTKRMFFMIRHLLVVTQSFWCLVESLSILLRNPWKSLAHNFTATAFVVAEQIYTNRDADIFNRTNSSSGGCVNTESGCPQPSLTYIPLVKRAGSLNLFFNLNLIIVFSSQCMQYVCPTLRRAFFLGRPTTCSRMLAIRGNPDVEPLRGALV